MNIKNLKWYFAALLIVVLSFTLIPETKYQTLGISIGIGTAALAAFFIFLGLAKIDSFSEITYFSENPKSKEISTILVPFLTLLFGTLLINSNFSKRLEAKIKKEGIIATATIDSGFTETTKTSSSSYSDNTLALTLVTDDNKEYKLVAEDVSPETYRKVGVGLDVEIIYLPQNPNIFRIIVDDQSVKKFKNISNRSIEFKDLEKIITAKEPEALEKALNKISTGWQRHQTEEEGFGFANHLKNEVVFLKPATKTLFYMCEKNYESEVFEIPKERIVKEQSDSVSVIYELDKYFIEKKIKYKRGEQNGFLNVENIIMTLK